MSFNFSDNYSIKRLIFVNSGKSAYTEIPLDQTAALFGRNNEGKTSGLSALKLFVLPETNFRDCPAKFGFKSKTGVFSKENSYSYYFPSDVSFIICEAQNEKGKFSMVLYRSREEWGYGRIALPVEYDVIKHLFWDFDSERNEGMGEPIDTTLKSVLADLKAHGGVELKNKQDIRDAIYTAPGHIDDLSRYCLVPLVGQGAGGTSEALSALLGLAFDIQGGATEALPNAIATIIECSSSDKKGDLSIDIAAITEDYRNLLATSRRLDGLYASVGRWEFLDKAHRDYREIRGTLNSQYQPLQQQLDIHSEAMEEKCTDLGLTANDLAEKWDKLKGKHTDSTKQLSSKQGAYGNTNREIEKQEALLQLVRRVKSDGRAQSWDESEIGDYIDDQLKQIDDEIQARNDLPKAQGKLEAVISDKATLVETNKALKAEFEAEAYSFLTELPEEAAHLLFSLNPALGDITGEPTLEQRLSIDDFAKLLSREGTGLGFIGEAVPGVSVKTFNLEARKKSIANQITKNDSQIEAFEKSAIKFRNMITLQDSPEENTRKIQEVREERAELVKAKKRLGSEDLMAEQIEELQEEASTMADVINDLLSEVETLRVTCLDAKAKHLKAKGDVGTLAISAVELSDLRATMRRLLEQGHVTRQPAVEGELPSITQTELKQRIEELDDAAQAKPAALREVQSGIHAIMQLGVLGEGNNIAMNPDADDIDLRQMVLRIGDAYEDLDGQKDNLQADIRKHNLQNSIRLETIRAIAETIKNQQNHINKDLAGYQISNLKGVKLEIVLDERFQSLLKNLDGVSFQEGQLKDEKFYQRLTSFCDDFFKDERSRGRIQLSRIITKVKYHYEMEHGSTDAGQSGGTSGMVSSALLAVLLKRLVPDYVNMRFPIVFDEIGSLDKGNLETIKRAVEDQGFVLFVVCPDNTGVVGSTIENWYDLSMMQVFEGELVQGATDPCSVLHYQMKEGISDVEAVA